MATNNAYGSSPPSLGPATPRQASATMTLDAIFREAGLSPPAGSHNAVLTDIIDIIAVANSILKSPTKWDDLDNVQKARLGFLIWKKQIERLLQALPRDDAWATALLNAVCMQDTTEYKTLTSFLQKGGDEPGNCNSDAEGFRGQFLRKHPEWDGADGRDGSHYLSLFGMESDFGQRLEPFVRFQTSESLVCWCISAFNAILYYMMLTTGTPRDEAIGQYGFNVDRFMRNGFTHDEVFRAIFRKDGGYPVNLIDKLLSSALPTGRDRDSFSFPLYLRPAMRATTIFEIVSTHIKELGPLIVCNFRVFPSYLDTRVTEFHGDWNDLKGTNDPHHAFLITGVGVDESTQKVVFEVQDSLPGRPFVNIGFDLLSSMGVKYIGIQKGAVFHGTSDEYAFDPVHIQSSPTSGCPSVSSAESQEIAAPALTFSDLSDLSLVFSSSRENLAQSGNDATDGDKGSSRHRSKPDWIGIDIPEGTDTKNLVLYS